MSESVASARTGTSDWDEASVFSTLSQQPDTNAKLNQISERVLDSDILLEALPEVSLQEVIVTTFLCMLFSSKKNKHKKNGTLFRFFIEMLMVLLL